MMTSSWLIIGISGVTCGGKTTLAKEFSELLPSTKIINQDDYFYPEDSGKHTLIPELNHFNWEILSSLDMEKMYADIQKIVHNNVMDIDVAKILEEFNKTNKANKNEQIVCKNIIHLIQNKLLKHNIKILLVEGFSIFNYEPIDKLCHFKFYLTLNKEICYQRRSKRSYIPADVPGYFDKCVWPEYLLCYEQVKKKSKNVIILTEKIEKKTLIIFQYLSFFFEKL